MHAHHSVLLTALTFAWLCAGEKPKKHHHKKENDGEGGYAGGEGAYGGGDSGYGGGQVQSSYGADQVSASLLQSLEIEAQEAAVLVDCTDTQHIMTNTHLDLLVE